MGKFVIMGKLFVTQVLSSQVSEKIEPTKTNGDTTSHIATKVYAVTTSYGATTTNDPTKTHGVTTSNIATKVHAYLVQFSVQGLFDTYNIFINLYGS